MTQRSKATSQLQPPQKQQLQPPQPPRGNAPQLQKQQQQIDAIFSRVHSLKIARESKDLAPLFAQLRQVHKRRLFFFCKTRHLLSLSNVLTLLSLR